MWSTTSPYLRCNLLITLDKNMEIGEECYDWIRIGSTQKQEQKSKCQRKEVTDCCASKTGGWNLKCFEDRAPVGGQGCFPGVWGKARNALLLKMNQVYRKTLFDHL